MVSSNITNRSTKRRPTLSAIANRVGCSKAVASTVINNSKGNTIVSDSLRKRVEEAALEIGYVPNFASRSLARKSTRMLGVYIPPGIWTGVGMMYEGRILRGIERTCQDKNYDILLINAAGSHNSENCIQKIAEQQVDGTLLVHVRANTPGLQQILESSRNIVAVDYNEPEPVKLDAVSFDNAAALMMAVEHLVKLGHSRIAYINPAILNPSPDSIARQNSFLASMKTFNLPVTAPFSGQEKSLGYKTAFQSAVEYALSLGAEKMPTAFVAYNDLLALETMHVLADKGLDVPGKVSIVGIDDSPFCSFARPQLTSIKHPLEQMGQQAVFMLLEKIEKINIDGLEDNDCGRRSIFQPELVLRGTTAQAYNG
ncbi:MAG TPA: hypothetical protein DCZ94_21330 [Lentisphaeria bacterium]|nr:MAG: hypothetical protein A2X48_01080 [Lentisphaerae bacterium GWF2_49_21]HBC89488.1 hypothetical protein [Lentisphaeria bacterium]